MLCPVAGGTSQWADNGKARLCVPCEFPYEPACLFPSKQADPFIVPRSKTVHTGCHFISYSSERKHLHFSRDLHLLWWTDMGLLRETIVCTPCSLRDRLVAIETAGSCPGQWCGSGGGMPTRSISLLVTLVQNTQGHCGGNRKLALAQTISFLPL